MEQRIVSQRQRSTEIRGGDSLGAVAQAGAPATGMTEDHSTATDRGATIAEIVRPC